jgi:hypothetical protein
MQTLLGGYRHGRAECLPWYLEQGAILEGKALGVNH